MIYFRISNTKNVSLVVLSLYCDSVIAVVGPTRLTTFVGGGFGPKEDDFFYIFFINNILTFKPVVCCLLVS